MILFPLMLALTQAPAQVTLRGLLSEMVAPDSLARWPDPAFTARQASSYDRRRIAPDKPNWFANDDGGHYLRTEEHDGRQERVLMEADGPGAIVRFFCTNGGGDDNCIRIYLDGGSSPTLEWPKSDLLSGRLAIGEPLLARNPPPEGHGGAVMYLPIPYQRHCKVTLEDRNQGNPSRLYYHVDYRSYAPGTSVETYSDAALESARPDIKRTCRLLQHPPKPATSKSVEVTRVLQGQEEVSLDLPAGPSAVRQLELSIGTNLSPAAREQALRSVVIRASFDDQPETVWCPVGDFAGSGAGGRPLTSWVRDVDGKGNSVCRWTMPYRTRGRLTLQNLGDQKVKVRLSARTGPWTWDERSLYFHCNWHSQAQIPSVPDRDWDFLHAQGRGVLVGDVMSVYNPLPSWYGEGDEKIWVDDDTFPSSIGTGTEDYYNASWAPNPVYQTPFSSQPRIDDPQSQGQNVYTRTRNLDVIPFQRSLKFDFEITTWKESFVDYATTTYWYAAPGATSNRQPQPEEARRPVQVLPAPLTVPNAIEIEGLPIVSKSPGLYVEIQNNRSFQLAWSANAHLLIRGRGVGDFVEVAIPAPSKLPKRLTLYATRANDYGVLRFSVNGHPVLGDFNGYAPNATPLNTVPLGVFAPVNGKFILRAEIIGADPKSIGMRYLAGLDAVVVSDP